MKKEVKVQLERQIKQVISLRNILKDLEQQKMEAERVLEDLMIMVEPDNPTLVFENWKLTRSPTMSYSLNEEGQKKLLEYGYETAYWKKTPNMSCIREDDVLSKFVVSSEGKTKITLKEQNSE